MSLEEQGSGRLCKAPAHFIDPEGVKTVFREGKRAGVISYAMPSLPPRQPQR